MRPQDPFLMSGSRFKGFIGVDQTGALRPGSKRPRSLKAVWVREKAYDQWTAGILDLPGFDARTVMEQLQSLTSGEPLHEWALGVDCVMGLPIEFGQASPWHWMEQAAARPAFGRDEAERFFSEILKGREGLPKRLCERIAGANSVFVSRPYQKNIQTGTFRIWKEMGSSGHGNWLQIWPFFEPSKLKKGLPVFFEAYPTFLWKSLFGASTRSPVGLRQRVRSVFRTQGLKLGFSGWNQIEADPDRADAAMIAFSMILLQHQNRLWSPWSELMSEKSLAKKEGWILGLNHPAGLDP